MHQCVVSVADAGAVLFQNGRVLKCTPVVLWWSRLLFYSETYVHFCGNYSMIGPNATKAVACFTVSDTDFLIFTLSLCKLLQTLIRSCQKYTSIIFLFFSKVGVAYSQVDFLQIVNHELSVAVGTAMECICGIICSQVSIKVTHYYYITHYYLVFGNGSGFSCKIRVMFLRFITACTWCMVYSYSYPGIVVKMSY